MSELLINDNDNFRNEDVSHIISTAITQLMNGSYSTVIWSLLYLELRMCFAQKNCEKQSLQTSNS